MRPTGFLFLIAYAVLSLTAIALVGPYRWDDSAITIAWIVCAST